MKNSLLDEALNQYIKSFPYIKKIDIIDLDTDNNLLSIDMEICEPEYIIAILTNKPSIIMFENKMKDLLYLLKINLNIKFIDKL